MAGESIEIDLGKNPCGCQAFFEGEKLLTYKCKKHKNKPVLVRIITKWK